MRPLITGSIVAVFIILVSASSCGCDSPELTPEQRERLATGIDRVRFEADRVTCFKTFHGISCLRDPGTPLPPAKVEECK